MTGAVFSITFYLLTYVLTPWSRDLLEKLTGFQLVKKFPAVYGTRKFITAFTSALHQSLLSWAIYISPPYDYITYLFTYLLTPWSRDLLEKLTGLQPVKKLPTFYGTRRFITSFTSARHMSLTWASSIQSIPPHPIFCRSTLYRLLTFHIPNLTSLFRCLVRRKVSVQVRGLPWLFRNMIRFYGEELLALRPNSKLEDHLLSAVRGCLFNIFVATLRSGGRSSIRNLRTRHAMVTGTHLSR